MKPLYKLSFICLLGACTVEPKDSYEYDFDSHELFTDRDDTTGSDFNLEMESDYWELRADHPHLEVSEEFEADDYYDVYKQYDSQSFDLLSQSDQDTLRIAYGASPGLVNNCLPLSCRVYVASIYNGEVTLIDSDEELLVFLGDIDTSAELDLWLKANSLDGLKYERNDDDTWSVLAEKDDTCGTITKSHLLVKPDGQIEKLGIVDVEEYGGCT